MAQNYLFSMRVSPTSDKYFTSIIQIYLFSWSIAVLSPQVRARKVASTCEEGCKYLRGRLQCFASEKGKTGTEINNPILDQSSFRCSKVRNDSFYS